MKNRGCVVVCATMLLRSLLGPVAVALFALLVGAALLGWPTASAPDLDNAHSAVDAVVVPAAVLPAGVAVDWTRRVVTTDGAGAASGASLSVAATRQMAERGAKLDARRKLYQGVLVLRTSAGKTVRELADDDAVYDVVDRFRITDTRYYSDGAVEVEVSLPLEIIDQLLAPDYVVP